MEASQKIWEKGTLRKYSGFYGDSEPTTKFQLNSGIQGRLFCAINLLRDFIIIRTSGNETPDITIY